MPSDNPISGPSNISAINTAQAAKSAQNVYAMEQQESEDSYLGTDDAAFSPFVINQRSQSLETRRGKKANETEKEEKAENLILKIEEIEEIAKKFQQENPELEARSLLLLRVRIKKGDSPDEILKKILDVYRDYALADEAIDFLLETADAEMKQKLQDIKQEINDKYGREIRAGRNIGAEARAFAAQGLGGPTGLRDMYRDITANPRETISLFDELSAKFPYEKMGTVIEFLLHSLGTDLKSKGPSISPGELHRLISETRGLQAILGVYRFFQSRMKLIYASYQKLGILLPSSLTFINAAKQFIRILQDRYPNVDKILLLAAEFGLLEVLNGQVILFSTYRDALRQVAPRLFRSEKHKQDLSLLLALSLEKLYEKIKEEDEDS